VDSFPGHLENFQDPDVDDERGETAAWKAARYDDLSKLKILDMACAKFDKQASRLERVFGGGSPTAGHQQLDVDNRFSGKIHMS